MGWQGLQLNVSYGAANNNGHEIVKDANGNDVRRVTPLFPDGKPESVNIHTYKFVNPSAWVHTVGLGAQAKFQVARPLALSAGMGYGRGTGFSYSGETVNNAQQTILASFGAETLHTPSLLLNLDASIQTGLGDLNVGAAINPGVTLAKIKGTFDAGQVHDIAQIGDSNSFALQSPIKEGTSAAFAFQVGGMIELCPDFSGILDGACVNLSGGALYTGKMGLEVGPFGNSTVNTQLPATWLFTAAGGLSFNFGDTGPVPVRVAAQTGYNSGFGAGGSVGATLFRPTVEVVPETPSTATLEGQINHFIRQETTIRDTLLTMKPEEPKTPEEAEALRALISDFDRVESAASRFLRNNDEALHKPENQSLLTKWDLELVPVSEELGEQIGTEEAPGLFRSALETYDLKQGE